MAFQVWWCKVGKFRIIGGDPGQWEYRPLIPKSMYALFEWSKTGGAYENGIVKIRIEDSEGMTVKQDTDWKALGCQPENIGTCEAEVLDYSDTYYENWEPIP